MKKGFWLRLALGTGFLLGLLLLARVLLTYNYVAGRLLIDHLGQRAGDYIAQAQIAVNSNDPENDQALQDILDEFLMERGDAVASIGVYDQLGAPLTFSGLQLSTSLDQLTLDEILVSGSQRVIERVRVDDDVFLLVTTPFRSRMGAGPPGPPGEDWVPGRPRFLIAQIALYLSGASDAYAPLKRNLMISIAAATALLLSITVVVLRLRTYLHGQELEQQLALAGQVQRELLPVELPAVSDLEISAEFEPAQGVAGDYYDVFVMKDGRISLLLGDVSGKGIPAAIIMASLHGSVQATDLESGSDRLSSRVSRLNQDLFARTPTDRFVTLVWSVYDPENRTLEYLNAGHPAPILLRASDSGPALIERLDPSGPLLGAFSTSRYTQSEKKLQSGDLLVFYSDGLDEAENRDGEMYGEDRVIKVVRSRAGESADAVREAIVRDVTSFTEGAGLQDDLTLLVVRIP